MNLLINSLQHVGVPVSDLKVSEAFYGRLGFHKVMEAGFERNGEQGVCVMMQREGIVFELYQLPPSELDEIRQRKNGHIDHVAFDVPDAVSAMKMLRDEGFNVIEDQPRTLAFWKKGVKFFFISGPDGERLEFNQIL